MIDEHAVTDLQLFIENDSRLHESTEVPIRKNLMTKRARGEYRHDLAVKAYGYLVEAGAKKYSKQFGSPGQPWNRLFPVAERRIVADNLTREFEASADLGEFDHLLPAKYRAAQTSSQMSVADRRSGAESRSGIEGDIKEYLRRRQ